MKTTLSRTSLLHRENISVSSRDKVQKTFAAKIKSYHYQNFWEVALLIKSMLGVTTTGICEKIIQCMYLRTRYGQYQFAQHFST